MRHRVMVLGAGYAGAAGAGVLARRLHSDDVDITVVNSSPHFVERMRLHQVAAGRDTGSRELAEMFAGTGIRLRVARVTSVDADRRTVSVDSGSGTEELGYDTLLYALGSTVGHGGVPGAAEHTLHVADREAASRVRDRLRELNGTGRVLFVGGNLTGIETATEVAQAHPGLRVTLATSGELGGWLGDQARSRTLAAFERLGVTVRENSAVTRVERGRATTDTGETLHADVIVWAAGFAVHPIAAHGGLAVNERGRMIVDEGMRSVSHPEVYAAGDSVLAVGDNGLPLPMSCASAGFTRMRATAAIIADLTGHRSWPTPLGYLGNCVSLGRDNAIYQGVDKQARAKASSLRGRGVAFFKRCVISTVAWTMGHPTYGLPVRRLRLTAPVRPAGAVAD
ncbi:FAD-dependent oxidoreductase [Nocardiopsis sp. NPDC007018]|uniref:NAD(P)/FAD-dependent oxidoreductase n=1 Tax=Nocardiopsis sp. NPDC007018 TaxID=3155721 RepID=UPI0033E1B454